MNGELFVIMLCLVIGVSILLAARRFAARKEKGVTYLPCQATVSILVLWGFQWLFGALFFGTLDLNESSSASDVGNLLFVLLVLAPLTTSIGSGIVWRIANSASEG